LTAGIFFILNRHPGATTRIIFPPPVQPGRRHSPTMGQPLQCLPFFRYFLQQTSLHFLTSACLSLLLPSSFLPMLPRLRQPRLLSIYPGSSRQPFLIAMSRDFKRKPPPPTPCPPHADTPESAGWLRFHRMSPRLKLSGLYCILVPLFMLR